MGRVSLFRLFSLCWAAAASDVSASLTFDGLGSWDEFLKNEPRFFQFFSERDGGVNVLFPWQLRDNLLTVDKGQNC